MDILQLVDKLEDLFNQSRSIWFTHSVIVDEERMLDIIDQMRVSIPEEIKKAREIINQRDRVLAQTQEEANRILALAHEKGEKLLERENLIKQTRTQADQIISQAEAESKRIRQDADNYVLDTLFQMEKHLEQVLRMTQNGIQELQGEAENQEIPES